MSDALIQSLNGRVSSLESENANLRAALKESRGKLKTSTERIATLEKEHGQAVEQRDKLEAAAKAAPSEQGKRIAELEQQLRQRDHRDAFSAAARKAGVSPDHVDDLYRLSGLTPPESGEITADSFGEFLGTAKTSRAWAFAASPDAGGSSGGAGNAGPSQPPPRPTQGPGGSQGAPDKTGRSFTVRQADMRDPAWMRIHGAEYVAAHKAGTLRVVD